MFITVSQLANKVNNLQRFTVQELQPETVYEIDLIDDYGNIFDYKYIHNVTDPEKIEQLAKDYCKAGKKAWNKNLYCKFYRIK